MQASFCRLCGSRSRILTLEHVPPKSTGNRGTFELAFFNASNAVERRAGRNGVGLRVLCDRCNSRTGSFLGTGFSDFAKQVRQSGRLEAPYGGVFVSTINVYPARIIRQLLLCYLCAQPNDDGDGWDDIRAFIQSRNGDLPPRAPRVCRQSRRLSRPSCSAGRDAPSASRNKASRCQTSQSWPHQSRT